MRHIGCCVVIVRAKVTFIQGVYIAMEPGLLFVAPVMEVGYIDLQVASVYPWFVVVTTGGSYVGIVQEQAWVQS